MDIVRGEQVETELYAMIRRRHEKRVASEGERAVEELWVESERGNREARGGSHGPSPAPTVCYRGGGRA